MQDENTKTSSTDYDFDGFLRYLRSRISSKSYFRDIVNKVKKCVFLFPKFEYEDVLHNVDKINGDRTLAKVVRLLLAYLEEK